MALCLSFFSSNVGNKIPILTFSFVFIRNKFLYYWIIDFLLWDFYFCCDLVLLNTLIILFLLWYCLVKHFDNIIQFLLKISLIWWDKFVCNFKYIFINETSFIKKIVIVMGKLTRSRVLWGGVGLHKALRGRDGVRKLSPSWGAGARMG